MKSILDGIGLRLADDGRMKQGPTASQKCASHEMFAFAASLDYERSVIFSPFRLE
jgi:hypothetical protein